MDWIAKIGGRKFWMALIATGVATYIETHSQTGLSATMASFLAGIVGLFSAANYASSAKHMDTKAGGGGITERLEQISSQLEAAAKPEIVGQLVSVLSNIDTKMAEVENVSRQVGSTVLNLTNEVQRIKR